MGLEEVEDHGVVGGSKVVEVVDQVDPAEAAYPNLTVEIIPAGGDIPVHRFSRSLICRRFICVYMLVC